MCDYINQNINQSFSLAQLSELAGFSRFHFNRQFAAHVGVPVFKFIQLTRLKRASYALVFETDKKIIDIALDARFENPESFSRAFKQASGQSPSQFRQKPDWPAWQEKLVFTSAKQQSLVSGGITMNVNIHQFKSTRVALIKHRGPVEKVLETAGKFIQWRKQTGLSPKNSSQTYGIIYEDPATVKPEDFRFDICGSVNREIPENLYGVVNSEISGGRCAVLRHKGSHDELDKKVCYLYNNWLPESAETLRDFPCYFHYLNLMGEVEEHELLTDIYLPLV